VNADPRMKEFFTEPLSRELSDALVDTEERKSAMTLQQI
jgi:hypothetical protein